MEKICLVEGGNFLLGIKVDNIVARKTPSELSHREQEHFDHDINKFHLESFLTGKPLTAIESNSVILQLKTNNESFFLIVDKIIGEVKAPDKIEPLPPLYPSLTKQLCPRLMLYENSVVMILDPTQVIPIHEKLNADTDLVSRKHIPLDVEPVQENHVPDSVTEAEQDEDTSTLLIDEETFGQIVNWTIAQFKNHKSGDEVIIGSNDLPSDLVRQEGLNHTVFQYLIDQAILHCKERFE